MDVAQLKDKIRELWSKNYSQRAIARTLTISRDTVRRVLREELGLIGSEPSPQDQSKPGTVYCPLPVLRSPSQRIGRCSACRAMVHLPCMACQVRRWVRVRKRWPSPLPEPVFARGRGRRSWRRRSTSSERVTRRTTPL